jgi:prefoldin alpha subunit
MAQTRDDKQQKLQEKYVQLQLVSMQIKQIEEQLEAIDQRAMEMIHLKDSLGRYGGLKKGTKSFVPVGQGIFTEASLGETNEVLVNVGAGVIVKKPIADAEETISNQMNQLNDITAELGENLKALAVKAHQLELELDSLQ